MKILLKNSIIITDKKHINGDKMLNFVIDFIDNEKDVKFVEHLYDEYMPFMKMRAYKYIQDMNICEDLAHDCMLNLIKHLDSVKALPEEKIRAYISVCISNIVKNYLKRESRIIPTGVHDLSEDYTLTSDTNIEEEVERKFDYQTIKEAFMELDERDKSLIIMKYTMCLHDRVIAETLNIKQNSTRMTLLRSVRKLKEIMESKEGKI